MSPESYTGSISEFAGNYAPRNFLPCDGRQLPVGNNPYTPLFAIIGTTYGGDGVKYFNLPDMRPVDDHGNRIDWRNAQQPIVCICYQGYWPDRG